MFWNMDVGIGTHSTMRALRRSGTNVCWDVWVLQSDDHLFLDSLWTVMDLLLLHELMVCGHSQCARYSW